MRQQAVDGPAGRGARPVGETLAELGAPAAARVDHVDAPAGGLKHAHGGVADGGIEEAREGVGHHHHRRAGTPRCRGSPAGDGRGWCQPAAQAAGDARAGGGETGHARPDGQQAVRVGEGAHDQSGAVGAMPVRQRLDLQAGHVHLGGALGRAALAPQTQLQRLVQALVGEAVRQAPLERGAQQHRTPARGVALIVKRLEAGAHGPGVGSARGVPVARLGGARQAALAPERHRGAVGASGGGGDETQAGSSGSGR